MKINYGMNVNDFIAIIVRSIHYYSHLYLFGLLDFDLYRLEGLFIIFIFYLDLTLQKYYKLFNSNIFIFYII